MYVHYAHPAAGLVFFLVYFVLQGLWAIQAAQAAEEGMLTLAQMKKKGINKGLPYLWHFGMWNDVIDINPWTALVFGIYGIDWVTETPWWFVGGVVLGILIAWGANYAWTRHKDIAEAHGSYGKMSGVGMIHIPHMAIIVTAVLMTVLWIFRGRVPGLFATGSAFLLIGHLCMGFHWPIKIFAPKWNPFPIERQIFYIAVGNLICWVAAMFCFSILLLAFLGLRG